MMRCSGGLTTTAGGATLSRQQTTSSSSTVRTVWCHLCSVQYICMCVCCIQVCTVGLKAAASQSDSCQQQPAACMHVTLHLVAGNENTPALLQNIATAISSATAVGGAEARRRRGSVAGGLQGDLWGQNPAVVLLADKPKEEMDAAVQEVIRWGLCPALYRHVHRLSVKEGGGEVRHQLCNKQTANLQGCAACWVRTCLCWCCCVATCDAVCRDRGYSLTVHTRQGHPFRPSQLKKVRQHSCGCTFPPSLLIPSYPCACSATESPAEVRVFSAMHAGCRCPHMRLPSWCCCTLSMHAPQPMQKHSRLRQVGGRAGGSSSSSGKTVQLNYLMTM